jgi:hypothetical protein
MRALGLLALLCTGCGYRFTAGGAPLPEGIRSVCAPVFLNQTAEPALGVFFTEALRAQLVRAGVAGGQGGCTGTIDGEVLSIAAGPTVLTNQLTPASYRLQATARLRLQKGGRLLSEVTVSGTEDYLTATGTAADVLAPEAQRQAALHRLADTLMRDGYERLASGW